jgi:hypothetical protein
MLRPFLAITVHWIGKAPRSTTLQLRAALIAFHHIPGSHTGDYIAQKLLELFDRANITDNMSGFKT